MGWRRAGCTFLVAGFLVGGCSQKAPPCSDPQVQATVIDLVKEGTIRQAAAALARAFGSLAAGFDVNSMPIKEEDKAKVEVSLAGFRGRGEVGTTRNCVVTATVTAKPKGPETTEVSYLVEIGEDKQVYVTLENQ